MESKGKHNFADFMFLDCGATSASFGSTRTFHSTLLLIYCMSWLYLNHPSGNQSIRKSVHQEIFASLVSKCSIVLNDLVAEVATENRDGAEGVGSGESSGQGGR